MGANLFLAPGFRRFEVVVFDDVEEVGGGAPMLLTGELIDTLGVGLG